jgi:general secretion pathway protein C
MKIAIVRQSNLNKALGLLVTAGFLAWAATQVAGTIWHIAAPESELSASGMSVDSGFIKDQGLSVGHAVDLGKLQSVFSLRPTGQTAVSSLTSDAAVQASETRLSLTLKGAIASSDPLRSRAIIASAEDQQVYLVGDSLSGMPGTVELQEVHQTFVLLNNNGRIETLRMDELPLSPVPSLAETSHSAVSNISTGATNVTNVTGAVNFPTGIARDTALTDIIRIQPVFESADSALAGTLRGLQIRHGSRGDFLSAVGLRQGDMITAIDGKQLNDASELPVLMAQLSTQQLVSLQVLRDEIPLTVVLDRSHW